MLHKTQNPTITAISKKNPRSFKAGELFRHQKVSSLTEEKGLAVKLSVSNTVGKGPFRAQGKS